MVPEYVDHVSGLFDSLAAHRACVAAVQREVLPHEHAQLVGRRVQLGPGHMAAHSYQVEAGVASQFDVAAHHLGRHRRWLGMGGEQVHALGEQPLAVHGEHTVVEGHLPQPGEHVVPVAQHSVEAHLHRHCGQRLVAQAPRPPQPRAGHVEVPGQLVAALGQRVIVFGQHVAVDHRGHLHPAGAIAVEASGEAEMRPTVVGVAAQHAAAIDLHRAGGADRDGSPQATRVPIGREGRAALEGAGECAAVHRGGLARARHLDGQHVLVGETGECRDVERRRDEVALGVAEVGAVEPHIGLIERAAHLHPHALIVGRFGQFEPMAVQQRAIAVGELGRRSPVPRHRHGGPVAVVALEADATAPQLVVGRASPPAAAQIHPGSVAVWIRS